MKKLSIASFILSLSCAAMIRAADQPTQFSYTSEDGITYKTTYSWDASTKMRISRHEKHIPLREGFTIVEIFTLRYNNKDVFQDRSVEYSQPKYFSLFNDPRFSTPKNQQNMPKKVSPIPRTYRAVVAKLLNDKADQ